MYSDNGTHFITVLSSKFSTFAEEWNFKHIISRPKYPQSNGFLEAGVKIIKRSIKKTELSTQALSCEWFFVSRIINGNKYPKFYTDFKG